MTERPLTFHKLTHNSAEKSHLLWRIFLQNERTFNLVLWGRYKLRQGGAPPWFTIRSSTIPSWLPIFRSLITSLSGTPKKYRTVRLYTARFKRNTEHKGQGAENRVPSEKFLPPVHRFNDRKSPIGQESNQTLPCDIKHKDVNPVEVLF